MRLVGLRHLRHRTLGLPNEFTKIHQIQLLFCQHQRQCDMNLGEKHGVLCCVDLGT
jgi:hypothetical protein